MIRVTKQDFIWSYLAKVSGIGTTIITLPLILSLLSAEEIGLNYLMITVGALVSLVDFGFAPQFGRNITYVLSGAKEIKQEGVQVIHESNNVVDYKLLANMIQTAKYVYFRLAILVLILLSTFGTFYIYMVTDGFSSVEDSLLIWIIFAFSIFFNIYYSYYNSLLTGKGLIQESKKVYVLTRVVTIVFTILLLLNGWGLLGVVLVNCLAPFLSRYMSYRYFFTYEMIEKIGNQIISLDEKKELFKKIWFNSKKLGLVLIGSYSINKLGMFLAGVFLSLETVASYGVMLQAFDLIVSISVTYLNVNEPFMASLRTRGENNELVKTFSMGLCIFYIMYIGGFLGVLILGPILLSLISANVVLPSLLIVAIFGIVVFLEQNHSLFATIIVTNNNVPFLVPSLVAGTMIAIGSYIILVYSSFGLLGIIIVQGTSQLMYNNWKWPKVVLHEFELKFHQILTIGYKAISNKFLKTSFEFGN